MMLDVREMLERLSELARTVFQAALNGNTWLTNHFQLVLLPLTC